MVTQYATGYCSGELPLRLTDTLYGLSILAFWVLALAVGVWWEVRQGGKW